MNQHSLTQFVAKLLLCAVASFAVVISIPCIAADLSNDRQASDHTQKQTKWALVIGNSKYAESPLENPENDANDLSAVLAKQGFTVIKKINATQSEMKRAVRDFSGHLKESRGIGLFYFAGHGVQVKGRNYLIPVGTDIRREYEVPDQSVDANLILDAFEYAENRLNIMILDACRNNPYARKFRSLGSGLSRMDAPSGVLIAFSTKPDSVAIDGNDGNGLYTKHLLTTLQTPGLTIEGVFKRVRELVEKDSDGQQSPREESSLKGADFYFLPPVGGGSSVGISSLDFDSLKLQAEKGNATAQAALGVRYASGIQGAPLSMPDARKWLEKGAQQGEPNAQFSLAWMYYSGNGVEKDFSKAIEWGLKAAEQGHRKAQYYAGSIYESGELGQNRDYKEAAKWYLKAAEQNETDAQTAVGRLFFLGHGVAQNHAEAFKWLSKGSAGGSNHAKADLAGLYLLGQGTTQDLQKAHELADEAAKAGSAAAKLILGRIYLEGLGQAKDPQKAKSLFLEAKAGGMWQAEGFLKAIDNQSDLTRSLSPNLLDPENETLLRKAEGGDAKAMFQLAALMEKADKDAQKKVKEIEQWYRRSASAGNGDAQSRLGQLIEAGQVERPDLDEAERLYRSAVQLDVPWSKYWLGKRLLQSKRSNDIQREGIKLLEVEANTGNHFAQSILGDTYYFGNGAIEEDHVSAKKWYELAAPQGNEWAQLRLGTLLLEQKDRTPTEVDRARALFQSSANQGNGFAMHQLGLMHELGLGVPQNLTLALKYYRPAAERDVWDAQYRVAIAYVKGLGGYSVDPKSALLWLSKASNSGYGQAMREYGLALAYGYGGMSSEVERARTLIHKAADQGDKQSREILNSGRLDHLGKPPLLGIEMKPESPGDNAKGLTGVRVALVRPDSAAAKASLKADDVIHSIDGKPLKNPDQLLEYLSKLPADRTVSLGVFRSGRLETISVLIP